MECVANYEINSECSIVDDDLVLKITHPKNNYRARIQNIKRSDFTTHFRLSLHLYFDAPSLEDSRDIAEFHLAACLNMLAFTTGSKYECHRIRQIVDATPGLEGMRSVLMWTDAIDHEDPKSFLKNDISSAIEKLSEYEMPPAIRRAMRWYRLGINADVPDDQFMYFWFAMEIVAEYQKSSDKVPDKCHQCGSPLYCDSCEAHPTHRPYPKQAIRALMQAVDNECDDATVNLIDKTRNSLMHGATLKEIEEGHAGLEDHIVDILGRLLFKALVYQFPHEMFDGNLATVFPSTFIHHIVGGIVHMQTVVPVGTDGDFDLSFSGFKAQIMTSGPPQSALSTVIKMDAEQYERLRKISYSKSEFQETFKRICERIKNQDDGIYALILSTDMALIRNGIDSDSKGDWQELFREIIGKNHE